VTLKLAGLGLGVGEGDGLGDGDGVGAGAGAGVGVPPIGGTIGLPLLSQPASASERMRAASGSRGLIVRIFMTP
jgi:hypothetical protein